MITRGPRYNTEAFYFAPELWFASAWPMDPLKTSRGLELSFKGTVKQNST